MWRDDPVPDGDVAQGQLYFDTIRPLRDALLVLAAGERARIVLDLSAVTLCDSSGLNVMVQAQRMAGGRAAGCGSSRRSRRRAGRWRAPTSPDCWACTTASTR